MSLEEKIVALLHEKIGFNPESVGIDKVLASVHAYLRNRVIPDPNAYFVGLRNGSKEFQDIVDAVIVPETWFFRDGEPFELLKRHVASEWLPRSGGEMLRCLSIPSSTGEEPYSIAMSLLDAGLVAGQFRVDGVDISTQSLQRAREGVFGPYSFRGTNQAFRDRYFVPAGNKFRLQPAVRSAVQFSHGNLLDPRFMSDAPQFDVIFCRNLLIYFDRPSWDLAIKSLSRLLKESGLLFMGHAEALEFTAPQYESVRFPCAFAYRKRRPPATPPPLPESAPRPARTRETTVMTRRPSRILAPDRHRSPVPAPAPAPLAAPAPAPVMDETLLKQASELADRGKSVEAALVCERHLASNPGSAAGYFLLGLIRESEGKSIDAEKHYNRALYLDSKHYEAMIHLALILEARGDTAGATVLRRRSNRLRQPE